MEWAKDLFPICRSLTGKGNIKTLNYFKKINRNFKIKSYRSGNKYFDPTIRHNGSFVKTKGYCTDLFFTAGMVWIKKIKDESYR